MPRWHLLISGVFFVSYLTFQLTYPALAWFRPGYGKFTWQMFSGLTETPHFSVHLANGTTRDAGLPLRRGNPVRLFGPSVDQARFVPPRLCVLWPDAREVVIRYTPSNREIRIPCP